MTPVSDDDDDDDDDDDESEVEPSPPPVGSPLCWPAGVVDVPGGVPGGVVGVGSQSNDVIMASTQGDHQEHSNSPAA